MDAIVIPYFDPPFGWIYSGLTHMSPNIYPSIDIKLTSEKEVTRNNVLAAVHRANEIYMFCHGNPTEIVLTKPKIEILMYVGDIDGISGKTMYALSCSLAQEFGKEFYEGGNNFIGYNQDVMMLVSPEMKKYFMPAFFRPMVDIKMGIPLSQAYYETLYEYVKAIKEVNQRFASTGDLAYHQAAMMLAHDMDSLTIYSKKMVKVPRPERKENTSSFSEIAEMFSTIMSVIYLIKLL